MEQKRKETAVVYKQQEIATEIYDMWITTSLAAQAKPGQFISVYTHDKSALLPRPISICETDRENGRLRIVYRVAGKGTAEFSRYKAGRHIDILGTLGNGFPLEKAKGKKVFLMGGGIGIPPMLELAKAIANNAGMKGRRHLLISLSDTVTRSSFWQRTCPNTEKCTLPRRMAARAQRAMSWMRLRQRGLRRM